MYSDRQMAAGAPPNRAFTALVEKGARRDPTTSNAATSKATRKPCGRVRDAIAATSPASRLRVGDKSALLLWAISIAPKESIRKSASVYAIEKTKAHGKT